MKQKKQVFKYLEENKLEMAQLLSRLIQIESINQGIPDTADESDAQEFIARYMGNMGLKVERYAFDKEQKRPNIIATYKGIGGGENILFNAHMDVVPVDSPDKWEYPPFGGVIKNGRVHGRGASDDKMGIACMVYAVKALQSCGVKLKGDVLLMSSIGEESCEGGTIGAGPATVAIKGKKPTCAVICEVTGMELQIESANSIFFEVIVKGKAAHVGTRNQVLFPQPYNVVSGNKVGVDALEKMLPIIEMFYRKERDWNLNVMRSDVLGAGGRPTHDSGGIGAFTINPCTFSGGGYIGSIPSVARVTYGAWFSNEISKEDFMKEITESINLIAKNDSWLCENPPQIRMPIIQDWPGFKTSLDSKQVQIMKRSYKDVIGKEPIVTGFKAACDATWIAEAGVPSIVMGPGTMANGVHAINEFCTIDEIIEAAKVYANMMINWCNQ